MLQMLGARPEVSERVSDQENDRIKFPYSLIEGRLRLLRRLGGYLLHRIEVLIKNYSPGVIVCTQVLPCMFCAKLKERGIISTPLVAVITDFGVHSYWIRPGVNAFIVPNSEVGKVLLTKGVSAKAIYEYGIPIDKRFGLAKDRLKMRERLGLDPDRFTVLLMGGGAGLLFDLRGAIKRWQKRNLPIQMLLVAGENEELKRRVVELKSRIRMPILVYGFIDNIDELMAASDLIITKPGGLTVSEAIASDLPIVLVRVIHGQEENNLKFLLGKGVALDGGKREIGKLLCKLYENPQELDDLKRRAKDFAYPDSAADIAQFILSHLTPR